MQQWDIDGMHLLLHPVSKVLQRIPLISIKFNCGWLNLSIAYCCDFWRGKNVFHWLCFNKFHLQNILQIHWLCLPQLLRFRFTVYYFSFVSTSFFWIRFLDLTLQNWFKIIGFWGHCVCLWVGIFQFHSIPYLDVFWWLLRF